MIEDGPRGEYEEVEVEAIKEGWNTYDLEDGTRLRARSVLTKVRWPKGTEAVPGSAVPIGASFNQIIIVFPQPKSRGPPNPRPPAPDEAASMKKEEVGIVDANEVWNVYRLPGKRGGLKTKMVVTSIFRVADTFDQEGNPYYLVNSTMVVGPTTARDIATP